eukprot:CCRYP_012788-RA/>CCRYP_012788-RA protein AED:0.22 eAED:0.78 QI:0/0/0/1/0/0/2/0/58
MIHLKQFPRFLFVLVGVLLRTEYAPNRSISCIKKYLRNFGKIWTPKNANCKMRHDGDL